MVPLPSQISAGTDLPGRFWAKIYLQPLGSMAQRAKFDEALWTGGGGGAV